MTQDTKTSPKVETTKSTFEISADLAHHFHLARVGNKIKLRKAMEEAITDWCKKHGYEYEPAETSDAGSDPESTAKLLE